MGATTTRLLTTAMQLLTTDMQLLTTTMQLLKFMGFASMQLLNHTAA